MFYPRETAFILGAGASWHYGYPTGDRLVKKVVDKARFAAEHISSVLHNGSATADLPKYVIRNFPHQTQKTIGDESFKSARIYLQDLQL
jgi:hypothetical protein